MPRRPSSMVEPEERVMWVLGWVCEMQRREEQNHKRLTKELAEARDELRRVNQTITALRTVRLPLEAA